MNMKIQKETGVNGKVKKSWEAQDGEGKMQSKRGTEWKNEAGEGNSWQERMQKDNFRSGREFITKKGSGRITSEVEGNSLQRKEVEG